MADDTDSSLELTDINGVGPSWADDLADEGYDSVERVADADPESLEADISGVGTERATEIVDNANTLVDKYGSEDDTEAISPETHDDAASYEDGSLTIADSDDGQLLAHSGSVETAPQLVVAGASDDAVTIELEIDDDVFPYVLHTVLEEALNQHQRNNKQLKTEAEDIAAVLSAGQTFDVGPVYEITLTKSQLTTLYRALRQGASAYGSRSGIPKMYGTLSNLAESVNEYR